VVAVSSAAEIRQLIELGREMTTHPVEVLDGVTDTLAALAPQHRLLLITKGDLHDQERKVARSGLAGYFQHIEIVSEKDAAAYRRIFSRHSIVPEKFLMVGNSLKSDILPVLELGGTGVHIPYHITWAAEHAEQPIAHPGRLFTLKNMGELPEVVRQWAQG
jgi:putative hydrolase of the HAD superfamily